MTAGAVARPPFRLAAGGAGARVWWATWALLAVAAAFAVVAGLDLSYLLRVRAALPAPDLAVLRTGQQLGTAEMVLFFVLLVVVFGWHRLGVVAVHGLGEDPAELLRTVPMTVFQAGAAATVVLAALLPGGSILAVDTFGVRLRWMLPILVARLALVALLGVAVLVLRRRIHAALLRSGVAPRRRGPAHGRTLASIVPRLPVAGDAWWAEVADWVAMDGDELVLEEELGDDRRTHLVGPGTDLAALRRELRPGATLTLYTGDPTDESLTAQLP
jgi:hypothetical protein